MKTMLELLIRLQEMRCFCEHARRNPQLTNGEKAVAWSRKRLVRECLPIEVLVHYDRMKKADRRLLSHPDIFAMAVLVSTWRSLSPAKRRKLAAHFAAPGPASAKRKTARRHGTTVILAHGARRYDLMDRNSVGEPWPRADQRS